MQNKNKTIEAAMMQSCLGKDEVSVGKLNVNVWNK